MTLPLPDPQTARSSRTVQRLKEANWASFDSPLPSPGMAQHQAAALEAALAAMRADADLLRTQLRALETSTIWRLTAPLRRAIIWLRPSRPLPAPPPPEPPASAKPRDYESWIEGCEPACLAELAAVQPGRQAVAPQRLGVVLLPGPALGAALARLLQACPPECRILALAGEGGLPAAPANLSVQPVPAGFQPADAVAFARTLDVDLVCFVDPRDTLAPEALRLVAGFAAGHPDADVIFADEDWLEAGRRVQPFFKPEWDEELQRGRDLLGPFTFFRAALLREASPESGPAWLYGLASQVAAAARPGSIRHIPAVLCHRAAPPAPAEALRGAAAAQLRRQGIAAQAVPASVPASMPAGAGGHRIVYALPQPAPLVSVVVPTRDHAELLSACADAVLRRTGYGRLELLIVDNGTVQAEALALLDRLAEDGRVRVLRHPGRFNWSAMNNAAARQAAGDVLLLLNNDTAALHPDWLSVMVSHAVQPGVGAVGPKLLYPDGRVQHAGITTDLAGIPRHLFRYAPGDSAGSFGLMATARQVWAVTGACMAVAREAFFAVGGLNEALPVAYNDVDFCLRLTAHGYRIVWTPWASVEHRELATRPPDHVPERRDHTREELDRLVRDWGRLVLHDPFLSANLHLEAEQPCFGAAAPPPLP